jgi:hypothetical protein
MRSRSPSRGLARCSGLFDSYTTARDSGRLLAYATVHGAWPELIIVDNLINIARGGTDDLSSQTQAMDELHALAQTTGAHVLVLHHAMGQYDDGDKVIPLSGIANKLSKLPANILTLYRKDRYLHLCVVKNRQGKADPTGKPAGPPPLDLERMKFTDPETMSDPLVHVALREVEVDFIVNASTPRKATAPPPRSASPSTAASSPPSSTSSSGGVRELMRRRHQGARSSLASPSWLLARPHPLGLLHVGGGGPPTGFAFRRPGHPRACAVMARSRR